MSTSAPTHVVEVNGDELRRYDVSPADVGLAEAPAGAISGGDPGGQRRGDARRLRGRDRARTPTWCCSTPAPRSTPAGAADDLAAGVELARETIASGAAARALEDYVRLTRERSPATA